MLDAVIRAQPRLTTMEDCGELERILKRLQGNGALTGSRATIRDLVLAEIVFIHLENDSGDLALVWKRIDALQRYGQLRNSRDKDANTLIKAQLLRVLAHFRREDLRGALESIAAFDETVGRFQVPGDRELVDRIKAARTRSQKDDALNALREKLLDLFQADVDFLIRTTARTDRKLSWFLGESEGARE